MGSGCPRPSMWMRRPPGPSRTISTSSLDWRRKKAVEFGSIALPPVPSGVHAPLFTMYASPAGCGAVFPPLGVTFRPSPRTTIACPAGVSAAGGYRCAVPSKLPDPSESSRSQPPDKSGIVVVAAEVPRCAVARALQPVTHTTKSSAPIANPRLLTIEPMTADINSDSVIVKSGIDGRGRPRDEVGFMDDRLALGSSDVRADG